MPHQFQIIDCKECSKTYCPVCEGLCPNCGKEDIADEETMEIRRKMRRHMSGPLKEKH